MEGPDFTMFFKQKNFLHSSLSSGLPIHSCYIPNCSGSKGYGSLGRAPSAQSPSGRRLGQKLCCLCCWVFRDTVWKISHHTTMQEQPHMDSNSLVSETPTGQRAILRYSVQNPDVDISTSMTLFFCSPETSSGYSSPFIPLSFVRDACSRGSLP